MAGKSRRVASRQSQLTRRKKRQQRGPSGIPAAGGIPVGVVEDNGADDTAGTLASAEAQPAGAAVATAAPATAAPSQTRHPSRPREERPSANTYMMPEIRRILIMATVGFAVLIALTFLL